MSDAVIEMEGVGKRFTKYDDRPTLFNALRLQRRTTRSHLWAVRGVDMEIQRGESVGVLGRNGAGKSTMLQMLAGVTAPTEGLVRVRGRVAPLISVGVGFHPELTGRENVYVNGTVLGMDRATVDRRFDDIVGFAELEKFIDTPVKFYSSGMFVRLGFAVAVEAEPDILLIDEILAVGDFNFQLRCFERMEAIRGNGTTLVVVSHNLNAVRGFCDRTVLLNQGQKVFDGPTFEGIGRYYQILGQAPREEDDEALPGETGRERDTLEILGFELHSAAGRPTAHLHSGDEGVFRVHVRALRDVTDPFVGFTIASESGVAVYSDTNRMTLFPSLLAGESATIDIKMRMSLAPGGFTASSSVHRAQGEGSVLLARAEPVQFFVSGRGMASGVADLGGQFSLERTP
ncbi:MAG TPA: ABC transporter ATP-binding protein [Mycobacteriales bacterium]|nr:ABC transporter ATP-binding protein [Mycobacteriales bacterium]